MIKKIHILELSGFVGIRVAADGLSRSGRFFTSRAHPSNGKQKDWIYIFLLFYLFPFIFVKFLHIARLVPVIVFIFLCPPACERFARFRHFVWYVNCHFVDLARVWWTMDCFFPGCDVCGQDYSSQYQLFCKKVLLRQD